eukprot:COSAG02_NODE_4237_length_5599_cov_6.352000_2_plen_263_part_00
MRGELLLLLLALLAGSALLEVRAEEAEVDSMDVAAVEAEVRAVYEKYNPEKLGKIDTIMFRYKGREADLLKDLKDKYKDAPLASEKPETTAGGDAAQLSIEDQIVALYEKHAPEKLDKVPGLLEKYKGSEAKLLRTIQEKYGDTSASSPPPPDSPPPPPVEPFMYESEEAVIEVTDELYSGTIKPDRSNLWVVEFYAPWCGHCKKFKPEYTNLATSLQDVEGIKIGACDATVHSELAKVRSQHPAAPSYEWFSPLRSHCLVV